ncbi:hypothetical protein PI124_g7161 [Phytophthora idaei]|nr:hypothetical protein PI124_g7161 [Phytophthora idaei]
MAPPKPAGEGDGNTPIAPPSSGQPGSPASVEDPRTSVRRLSTRLHSLSAQLQDATATREGVRTEHGETRRDLRDPTGIQPADQIRILRQQLHGQAMEIQGWGHTTDSRDRDLRRQLADEARQIYDLESRLDHVFLQRDHLRQSNDHLFQEMRLAGSEIDGLHTRIWDQERELADAVAANMASEESLQRLQEELRLTQEEVVTNAYDSAPPDQASWDLAQAQSEVTRLPHDLRVARESTAGLTTERDQARHDRGNVTAERGRLRLPVSGLAVERDRAVAEWGVATRKQTELESSIRDLSDKLKTARDAADTLNRQRDEALHRLAAVAETAGRPIRVPGVPSIPVTSAGVSVGGSGSTAVVSGSFSQASSGSAIPAVGTPDPPNHGSGSSASTSAPAPAKKSTSPGPISSGGDTAQTAAKRPQSGSASSDVESSRTRKQPRTPPAGVDQVTKTVDLTTGEIDDDGGASGEIEDDGGVSWSGNRGSTGKTSAQPKGKQPIPRGFGFSSSDEDNEDDEGDDDHEDSEEAEIADELLEEDTRRAPSQSRSEARRRSHATPSRHPIGGSGGPPGGSGDSDDDDLGAGPPGSGAGPAGPAGSGGPAGGSGGHHSGSPGSVFGRAGSTSPGVRPSGSSGSGARSTVPSSSGGAQGGSTSRSATTVSKSTPAPDLLPENPFEVR